jgi:hypothetical protein
MPRPAAAIQIAEKPTHPNWNLSPEENPEAHVGSKMGFE